MKTRLFFLLALLLMSCALPDAVWTKPGVTTEQYANDSADCEAQVNENNFGVGPTSGSNKKAFYERCMKSLGYTKQGEVEDPHRKSGPPGVLEQ